jgi:hypothetical protein
LLWSRDVSAAGAAREIHDAVRVSPIAFDKMTLIRGEVTAADALSEVSGLVIAFGTFHNLSVTTKEGCSCALDKIVQRVPIID